MNLGIIGPGLIGGSMAVDLRRRGFAGEVLAVEKDAVAADAALRLGLADTVVELEDCVRRCDMVVLAVPVDAALVLLPRILDLVDGTGKTVLDVCSVKEPLCKAASGHPARGRYVATHPMAGTEYSGPWAAQPGLFDGRACIFCDAKASDPDALELAERLYGVLNMRLSRLGAAEHDLLRPGTDGAGQGKGRKAHLRPGLRRLRVHRSPCKEFPGHVEAHSVAQPRQCA